MGEVLSDWGTWCSDRVWSPEPLLIGSQLLSISAPKKFYTLFKPPIVSPYKCNALFIKISKERKESLGANQPFAFC